VCFESDLKNKNNESQTSEAADNLIVAGLTLIVLGFLLHFVNSLQTVGSLQNLSTHEVSQIAAPLAFAGGFVLILAGLPAFGLLIFILSIILFLM
jgi:hypothetical protein